MTIYQIFELCQVEVPQAGETMILSILNEKIKDFAHSSEIYKRTGDITIVANTVEYTLATEFTDIDGEKIVKIDFLDSDSEQVESIYQLKYDIFEGKIRFYSYLGNSITEIPSAIYYIRIQYVAVPATKTINSTLTEIDSQFHEGLRAGVMATLYKLYATIDKVFPDGGFAKIKDMASMQYNEVLYDKTIHKAMRYANSGTSIPKAIITPSY